MLEQEYEIEWIEAKTSAKGTNYHRATLKAEDKSWTDVAIFKGFNAEDLVPGGKVKGILEEKEYMGKPSYTLNAPVSPKTASAGAFKAQQIEKAVERKEASISRFQGDKEYSIKVSSTFRAAVDSAIAEYQEMRRVSVSTDADIEKLFKKWRAFFWSSFDVVETDYPPTGIRGL